MDDSAADNGTHHNTLQGVAGVRAVSPLGGKPGGVDRPLSIRVEHGDVGDSPAPQRPPGQVERSGRRDGHPVDQGRQVDDARPDKPFDHDGQRRLQADDPVRRVRELPLLLIVVVRRVVRRDEIDGPVAHSAFVLYPFTTSSVSDR